MKSKVKGELKRRETDILIALPQFLNELLLLINSGIPLEESFRRIASSYSLEDKNYLRHELKEMSNTREKTNESIVKMFYMFAKLSNVKELDRVSSIIFDGYKSGVDIYLKLNELRDSLWGNRKRIALEKIRLNESKMSFPLGMMLIALIVITAMPAMIQI